MRPADWLREIKDFLRLQEESEKQRIQLLFYAESGMFFRYYEDVIAELLRRSEGVIHYVTSDPRDALLSQAPERLQVYLIRAGLGAFMAGVRARVVLMTMPDLGVYHVKRSPHVGQYVYLFHAVSSTHYGYRFEALVHYDVILCVGPHHVAELRKAEEIYGHRAKRLVEAGYPWLDRIFRDHQGRGEAGPMVLVASSWGQNSILGTCARDIVEALATSDTRVVIRPHPEYCKREPRQLKALQQSVARHAHMQVETALDGRASMHEATVLITDGSGFAFEYAFGTERPVLFLDVPLRVENDRWPELGIEPIDLSLRAPLGRVVTLAEVRGLAAVVADMQAAMATYRQQMVALRGQYVYHFERSASVYADTILELL